MAVPHHPRIHVGTIRPHAIVYDPVIAAASRRTGGGARLRQEGIKSLGACLPAPIRLAGGVVAHLAALRRVDAFEADPHSVNLDRIAVLGDAYFENQYIEQQHRLATGFGFTGRDTISEIKQLLDDLAPKFYPVLSSLQWFCEVLPDFGPAGAGIFRGYGSCRRWCR